MILTDFILTRQSFVKISVLEISLCGFITQKSFSCNFTKRNLKRDRSDHQNTDYYRDPDEKEQLIEDDEDVVHFSATSGFQIDSFKDNLEYHLGTIKSTLGRFIHFLSFLLISTVLC